MATERPPYTRIENEHEHEHEHDASPAPTAPAPRTLRHKVSRVLTTLTRRDPTSPERERGPTPPLPTPCTVAALSPATSTSTSTTSTTSTAVETEKPQVRERRSQNALKRTWMARTRSEPALRAKRAKAAAAALIPAAVPSRSAPPAPVPATTSHSRDVNAYVPDRGEGAVVSYYTYPVWRIDPVLVGCFVCL
ncbi:hypothetical protein GSI_09751 [Ganoderma sinense ZZ0214-1]|uniref:Uncharacterized protein n=1 Tax=Ganoderma sinense ZZ0214-1 TaxID=1077348 RepID=A0A2G8S2U9_9APHY|nr:hypothetical protein GSI_09751 [Ganoderma sinense ZZ0214-1]